MSARGVGAGAVGAHCEAAVAVALAVGLADLARVGAGDARPRLGPGEVHLVRVADHRAGRQRVRALGAATLARRSLALVGAGVGRAEIVAGGAAAGLGLVVAAALAAERRRVMPGPLHLPSR